MRLGGADRCGLGPDHPTTVATATNIGGVYLEMRRFGEAEPLMRNQLVQAERVFGPDHRETWAPRCVLGFI